MCARVAWATAVVCKLVCAAAVAMAVMVAAEVVACWVCAHAHMPPQKLIVFGLHGAFETDPRFSFVGHRGGFASCVRGRGPYAAKIYGIRIMDFSVVHVCSPTS